MALHLNFYHEIEREAQARARDPFKLAALGGVVVAVLLVGYYFQRGRAVSADESRLAAMQADWAKLEPAKATAKKRETELFNLQKRNKALVQRLQGRFYWAPLLAKIAAATPPTVQIMTLTGECRSASSVGLTLVGIAAGPQPRSAAEDFRRALEKEIGERFPGVSVDFERANSLEETGENVEWEGQALPTARFSIRLVFDPRPPKAAPPSTHNAHNAQSAQKAQGGKKP